MDPVCFLGDVRYGLPFGRVTHSSEKDLGLCSAKWRPTTERLNQACKRRRVGGRNVLGAMPPARAAIYSCSMDREMRERPS
jgi:hypothetical protein